MKFEKMSDLRHFVLLRNDSSGTFLISRQDVQLVELKKEGVVIIVPKNSCVVSHNVTLCFIKLPFKEAIKQFPLPGKIKGGLEIMGRIKIITPNEDAAETITVEIDYTQYDVQNWETLVESYISKQTNFNKLKVKL
ncbi:MAG: hypothetical protein HOE90_12775 [Bacteriovoracaceae bacterium]|jgi:hypothetical protein|nr:hypothetical protein [Bacteriovoracaceae bacterium]